MCERPVLCVCVCVCVCLLQVGELTGAIAQMPDKVKEEIKPALDQLEEAAKRLAEVEEAAMTGKQTKANME